MDDSDSDDGKKVNGSNVEKTKSSSKESSKSKKRRVIYSSDEDEPKASNDKNSTVSSKVSKLKAVNVGSAFGSQPIKRVEKEKKPKKKAEKDVFDADTDDMDLMNVDEELLSPNSTKPSSSKTEVKVKAEKQSPVKEKPILKNKNNKTPEKVKTEKKSPEAVKVEKKTPIKKEKQSPQESTEKETSATKKKQSKPASSSSKKPSKPADDDEVMDLDQSVFDTDQEKHERRRAAAMLYKQFQKRAGPSNPGSKEIPKGTPNCLAGLAFVLTGIYESMEREEAEAVIKSMGGRVTSALSGKTNYMVSGEDSGPAKLAKAEDMKIPIISEDDLLDLIREKSGMPTLQKKTQIKEEKDTKSPNKADKKTRKETPTDHESPKKPKLDKISIKLEGMCMCSKVFIFECKLIKKINCI